MGVDRRKVGFMWTLWWRPILTLLFPLLLSSILFWKGTPLPDKVNPKTGKPTPPPLQWKQARAAFIVILMGCYWVSECLPLPLTALCPIFLVPFMEIVDTDKVAGAYLNGSVLLLTAGCIMAQAFEYCNLHSRIALKVACIVGARIPILLGGVMFTSMFLSMWMNNTSTTSMMIPVIAVIMEEFEATVNEPSHDVTKQELSEVKPEVILPPTDPAAVEPTEIPSSGTEIISETNPKPVEDVSVSSKEMEALKAQKLAEARNIKIMFFLGAAWASNLGGTGIIIGSATNIIAQTSMSDARAAVDREGGVKDKNKCKDLLEITFLGWIEFNVVPMLISTILTWMILILWFTGLPRFLKFRKVNSSQQQEAAVERRTLTRNVEKAILVKYQQLGKITLHEILVFVIFFVLVVLWVTQKIGTWGWYTLFTDKPNINYTHPAVPAALMCMLLFIIPKEAKYYKDIFNGGLARGLKDPLLPWSEVETKLPWGPLILIGGGGALSIVIIDSGLGPAIGEFLSSGALKALPKEAYLLIILLVVAALTTIASNTATASILSPVLINLSLKKGIHPLYLLIPATTSASYAFILPISTPPNAIAFDKSDMKQKEMALPGIIVTLVTNAVLFGMIHSYCELIFKFNDYKDYCGSTK